MGTLCGSILDESTKKRIEQRKNQKEKKSKHIKKTSNIGNKKTE
jgi:hypothetical protein